MRVVSAVAYMDQWIIHTPGTAGKEKYVRSVRLHFT